jgi:hypothetical protein
MRSLAMRFVLLAGVLLLGGCDLVRFYLNETSGVPPTKLVPLFFQEREYAEDQRLVAKVKGVLAADAALRAADIAVDAYKMQVTLQGKGVPTEHMSKAQALTRDVPGVKSVEVR